MLRAGSLRTEGLGAGGLRTGVLRPRVDPGTQLSGHMVPGQPPCDGQGALCAEDRNP